MESNEQPVPASAEQPQKPKTKVREKKSPQSAPSATIYIGPTLGRGKLMQNTTFRGELPARVKALIEENPKLARLIVPVAKLAEASKRAATPGTPEYSAVQNLMEGKV